MTTGPGCCLTGQVTRGAAVCWEIRSAWPGGCSGERWPAGRPVSCSPARPRAPLPRASMPWSAGARASGTSSPGWVARVPSPTPTWPRSCRWRAWPRPPTPSPPCCGCARRKRRSWPSRCWPPRPGGSGGRSATWRSPSPGPACCSSRRGGGRPRLRARAGDAGTEVSQPGRRGAGAMAGRAGRGRGPRSSCSVPFPRAAVAGGWTAVSAAVLAVFFGPLLRFPQWLLDISPFTHVPKLPGATVQARAAAVAHAGRGAAGRRGPGRAAAARHRLNAPRATPGRSYRAASPGSCPATADVSASTVSGARAQPGFRGTHGPAPFGISTSGRR